MRRILLVAAAALAMGALFAMHGMPVVATSMTPQPSAHSAMPPVAIAGHADHGAATFVGTTGIGVVETATHDRPAPHAHSLAHLCLAILAGTLVLLILTLRRRPIAGVSRMAVARERVRTLVPRAVGPPSLSELCLLRC